MNEDRLTRSETDRMIAGVCGGVAEFFTLDPTVVRIVFVVATLFGGGGLLLYIAMWMIMPPASQVDAPGRDVLRNNVAEGRQFAEDSARRARESIDRLRGATPDRHEQAAPPPTGQPPPPADEDPRPPLP